VPRPEDPDPLVEEPPLPPPPERRLPPWADAARRRMGLDGRAWAWVAAVVVAVLAGAWLLRPGPVAVEETLPMASASSVAAGGSATVPTSSSSSVPSEVVAHAAGAVVRPGVYALDVTARVDDLVRAAGGLAPDADVARINLAAPLADGARVYVPRVGEGEAPPVVGPDGGPLAPTGPDGAPADEAAPAAPIDLNTATEAELDELPGVGPSIAAAIVTFREQNGGFTSVEDLLDVRGIGEARLAEIRPLVTV
jgi:competence protein ComEA